MNVLSELVPRQVGTRVTEPGVAFDEASRTAHAIGRCPITCSYPCIATSHSGFDADS